VDPRKPPRGGFFVAGIRSAEVEAGASVRAVNRAAP
jgi:hypothetical protein